MDKLVDNVLDKNKMNPKAIAEKLSKVGCSFECNFVSYTVTPILEKHDAGLGKGIVRLIFKLANDANEEESGQLSDLDYTHDMFVSDIGTAFGVLLGLSLIDIALHTSHSLMALMTGFCLAKKSGIKQFFKDFVMNIYTSSKWISVAAFLGVIIVTSLLTTDFGYSLQEGFAGGDSDLTIDIFREERVKADVIFGFQKGLLKINTTTSLIKMVFILQIPLNVPTVLNWEMVSVMTELTLKNAILTWKIAANQQR